MKNNSALLIFIFALLSVSPVYGQFSDFDAGLSLGGGSIKGNSPSIGAMSGEIFGGFKAWFSDDVRFRINILYARKPEYFLPDNSKGKYYPFLAGGGINACISQNFSERLHLEEEAGIILLNDRTFSDRNSWSAGVNFNLAAEIDLRENHLKRGYAAAAGTSWGITFNDTRPTYYLLFLRLRYIFG